MYSRFIITAAIFAASGAVATAQSSERQANFTGNRNSSEGKCTIEVVVDGSADVEVQGDRAVLRTLSGQPAQWRRFQCNAPLPGNPGDFRFKGIDGRGRQELIQDPRRGGVAVVRIEDRDNGQEGYTFDLIWKGGSYSGQDRSGFDRDLDRLDRDADRRFDQTRRFGDRVTEDRAIQACEDAVIDQAADRLRPQVIAIRRTGMDNAPGRDDWVVGVFEVRRGTNWDRYRFSCSVNFDNGRLRSVDFQPSGRR
jgi:hypothetical protein